MNRNIFIFLAVIIALIVLFTLGNKQSKKNQEVAVSPDGTEIPCLPNGHQQVANHIHPVLSISVNGESEILPANIGVEGSCMREIHTHDTSGAVHIETAKMGVTYTLADFFTIWGQSSEREGYTLEITQDDEIKESVGDVVLTDHSVITLRYTSI